MQNFKILATTAIYILLFNLGLSAQKNKLENEAKNTMLQATKFMVEEVSYNGGYVWNYLPDFTRRWGEMEAYKTMIWLQNPGTISMGNMFLESYHTTGDEYYYQAAEKVAAAVIWGQSNEGGWHYMIDFAGDRSFKKWYSTIGKNAWRLEEFQHYYGNSTFDDDVTSEVARFVLRIYLEKFDPKYKPALDKAIDFILTSQYPIGGWPQRYPLKYDFNKTGHPDYTSYYTFNDDVTWENINFLIQCYQTLGEERFLDPIRRGMNFYLISQDGSGGWAQQITMDLKPAGARTYELEALLPRDAFGNAMLCLKFYEYTGERKFLTHVPDAIEFLEKTKLPESMTDGGKYTHATFIEQGTFKPMFVHRKGSNVIHGYYYHDYNDKNLLGHYGGKGNINIEALKEEYNRLSVLPVEEVTKNSPLKVEAFQGEGTPQNSYNFNRFNREIVPEESQIREIINSLDDQNRWLTNQGTTSNPYTKDGEKTELTDKYASTHVGDETDTSPYRDTSGQQYISTRTYLMNMFMLNSYIKSKK